MSATEGALFCFLCIIVNISTFAAYKKRFSKTIKSSAKEIKSANVEIRLTIYSFLLFISQVCLVILLVII